MSAISIKLPDEMAAESMKVAEELGITRSELIRQALNHEIESFKAQKERNAMAEAFQVMKREAAYVTESSDIESGFSNDLPDEKDEWWKG